MSVDTSVIITNYNNKQYLGRAIRSCLKQSLDKSRYEIIVVDDASTDKSRDVIVGFKNQIRPILLDENVGVAEASNAGIRSAVGRFIIRVDSDDYINENTLLFMTELLDNNHDMGFVYCDHLRVDAQERVQERVNLDTIEKIFRHGAGMMFRKSYLEAIGLYDSEFKNAEDFDLLSRYIKNFNGYHLKMSLYRYRQHDTNMTNDSETRKEWEQKVNDKNRKQRDR